MPTKLTGAGEYLDDSLDGRAAKREWKERMAATKRVMDLNDEQFDDQKASDAAQDALIREYLSRKR